MPLNKEIESKLRKTRNDFLFRYETILLTLSKRFRHKEERHNLLCCLIHLAPISNGHHRAQVRLASASSKSLASSTQLSNFLSILHKPLRASGAWRHMHPVTPFRHLGLLWHLWVARPLCAHTRARVNTYIKLHLTNPCAEPKGSQPN